MKSVSPPNPTLEEWLSVPRSDLAKTVAAHKLAVLLSIDGTRRHFLLHAPKEQIHDFQAYARHCADNYVRVYDLLFSLGIESIMTPFLYPLNFERGGAYLTESLKMGKLFLLNAPFTDLYTRWHAKARLYGDYDIAPNAAEVRTETCELAAALAAIAPEGERRLFFGYCAGLFSQEMISRTVAIYQATGQQPDEEQLRLACFPDGPENLNILIGAGWLRVGLILPSLLDRGATDLYNLTHLALDLQEGIMRKILYDHLFRRWAGPEDDAAYSADDLFALKTYYQEHQNCVVGLGSLVGPGLWYADHDHQREGAKILDGLASKHGHR